MADAFLARARASLVSVCYRTDPWPVGFDHAASASATDGMARIAKLVFWSDMLDFMSFHLTVVRRLTAAPRWCRVSDGKPRRTNPRREWNTDGESNAMVRQAGVEDIANVECMCPEADGEMSRFRRDEPRAGT